MLLSNFLSAGTEELTFCSFCDKETMVKWSYDRHERDGITAENVLCGRCQTCDRVCLLDGCAGFRFKSAREDAKNSRTTVAIPLEMEDYVSFRLSRAGADSGHQALFFRALLLCCLDREDECGAMARKVEHEALNRAPVVRMPIVFTEKLKEVFAKVQAASGLSNASDLMRRLIVLSSDAWSERMDGELRRLAYAYA